MTSIEKRFGPLQFQNRVVLATDDSAWISARMGSMRIRGGGLGGGAKLAQITGADEKYILARKFIKDDISGVSKSGMSGFVTWQMPKEPDGIYEYRGWCAGSTKETSGFIFVEDGEVAMLRCTREDLRDYLEAEAAK